MSAVFNRMNTELVRLDGERKLLLAGVSHDVRTPLTRLRLALDALPEPVDRDIKQGAIADVEDIDAILDHFLSFVRTADDQTRVEGNLDELVATVCDRYERAGKAVRCDLGSLPLVHFYPVGLRRLLMNLIDNALKHGGGCAHARARRTSIRLSRCSIAVRVSPRLIFRECCNLFSAWTARVALAGLASVLPLPTA